MASSQATGSPGTAPSQEVHTSVGTLSAPNTPSPAGHIAHQHVAELRSEMLEASKALEQAKTALEDANLALLKSTSHCFCLFPSRYEEFKTAKYRVHQAETNVQDGENHLAKTVNMLNDILLQIAKKVNKLALILSSTCPSATDPWESQLSSSSIRPKGQREKASRLYGLRCVAGRGYHCEMLSDRNYWK
jgi:hypothetical protein